MSYQIESVKSKQVVHMKEKEMKNMIKIDTDKKRLKKRLFLNRFFKHLFSLSVIFALLVLGILFYRIIADSIGWLNIKFLTGNLSIFPEKAGIYGVIVGSVWLMSIVVPVTMVLGVSTAIYLEEYAKKGNIQMLIKVNISNLASVPSVIFGLLGLAVFSIFFKVDRSGNAKNHRHRHYDRHQPDRTYYNTVYACLFSEFG